MLLFLFLVLLLNHFPPLPLAVIRYRYYLLTPILRLEGGHWTVPLASLGLHDHLCLTLDELACEGLFFLPTVCSFLHLKEHMQFTIFSIVQSQFQNWVGRLNIRTKFENVRQE